MDDLQAVLNAMKKCMNTKCKECMYHRDEEDCMSNMLRDASNLLHGLESENRALRTELAVNRKGDVPKTNVGDIPDQKPKSDAGKPRLTLVPPKIIWDIAAVRQYGVEVKYPETGMDGWRTIGEGRIKDAAARHFLRYITDPIGKDEESGLPHLWHLATNVAFLCELEGGTHD